MAEADSRGGGGGATGVRPPLKSFNLVGFLQHGMQCTLDFRSAHSICTKHSACNALRVKSSANGMRDSGSIDLKLFFSLFIPH